MPTSSVITAKMQLLAVGDTQGNLHIFEVPRSLARAHPNEAALMSTFVEREVAHCAYVAARSEVRRDEAAALAAAAEGADAAGGGDEGKGAGGEGGDSGDDGGGNGGGGGGDGGGHGNKGPNGGTNGKLKSEAEATFRMSEAEVKEANDAYAAAEGGFLW